MPIVMSRAVGKKFCCVPEDALILNVYSGYRPEEIQIAYIDDAGKTRGVFCTSGNYDIDDDDWYWAKFPGCDWTHVVTPGCALYDAMNAIVSVVTLTNNGEVPEALVDRVRELVR